MISWFTLTFRGAVLPGLPSLPIQPGFDHFVASVDYKCSLESRRGSRCPLAAFTGHCPRFREFPLLGV